MLVFADPHALVYFNQAGGPTVRNIYWTKRVRCIYLVIRDVAAQRDGLAYLETSEVILHLENALRAAWNSIQSHTSTNWGFCVWFHAPIHFMGYAHVQRMSFIYHPILPIRDGSIMLTMARNIHD
jgi:hypothetical protein